MLAEATPDQLGNLGILRVPEYLALDLKEKILAHIPACYVSEVEFRGHQRLFCSGEYCFRQPVPKAVLFKACKKAGVIK